MDSKQNGSPAGVSGFRAIAASLALITLGACASAGKQKELHLSAFEGKRVALVDIDGTPTAKKISEVALVNGMSRAGIEPVSKQDITAARVAPDQDPSDWKGIARRAGADYALRVKVLDFSSQVSTGYTKVEVLDSALADERGDDGKDVQMVKAKALDGHVKYTMEFTDLQTGEIRSGTAEKSERVTEEARTVAIHLPPQLRFLESLSNSAFDEFFHKYK